MCGIAGILQLNHAPSSDPRDLQTMLDAIVHRGPDDDGALIDRQLAMGMRRLSIIDLAGGKQPIQNEDRRFSVILNGEIYNYVELRKELETRGHQFRTRSDTEVIVHLFEEHGKDCVRHLRGMFSFAIWDHRQQELFLYRDRLGIKPLYYLQDKNRIVFASEIKSILALPQHHAELDPQALGDYLSLKYVPAPRTLFRGIQSLPPGHMIHVKNQHIDVQSYWDLSFANPLPKLSEQQYVDRLHDILQESIQLRLRSDVPFGAFLSGGLDSSVIVALMANQLEEPVNTFSVGFSSAEGTDELPYARQVAKLFGCNHHEISIGADEFLSHANQVMWHLEQPIADQATVATFMVAKLAREHVKVVLTGEGGDELFAGYARYVGENYSKYFQWIPKPLKHLIRLTASQLPGLRRQKIAIHALTQSNEISRLANWFPLFNNDMKAQVLAQTWRPRLTGQLESIVHHLERCDSSSALTRMLYVDSKSWLPDYLLLRGDKLTMANSLEGRVPFLDHHLVEFACGLPDPMRLNGSHRKYILKKVAERYLPEQIVHRKKQGFPIPVETWLRHEANSMMHDLLAPETIQRRGWFDPDVVARLIQRHESGYADHAVELWGLMSVELWYQNFIDNQKFEAPTPMENLTTC